MRWPENAIKYPVESLAGGSASKVAEPAVQYMPQPRLPQHWAGFRSMPEIDPESESPFSALALHDLVTRGLSTTEARSIIDGFHVITPETVLSTFGVSERTLQRADASGKTLDSNVTDRALRLKAVMNQAIGVLGAQEAAERWLIAPALGLSGRRPIDLLQSSEGTTLVKTLLSRMDYGVYA